MNKEEFMKMMKKQLDDLNYRWSIERNKFEAKAQHLSADARKAYDEEVKKLRALQTELKTRLADLETSGEGAWGELKKGAEHAWKALGEAIKKASSHFK